MTPDNWQEPEEVLANVSQEIIHLSTSGYDRSPSANSKTRVSYTSSTQIAAGAFHESSVTSGIAGVEDERQILIY
ncbi:hypothetical protein BTUL_0151g00080 [Botrytis tulipae]|uniref:Uncharacterized protein n=1 Tax=Botrytis tulipae TaxID=87230 RepID=A0A4Z1ECA8_9HELO|nr:hypothetical protein BTUL_0151g00080 [Botrytis tulipae]